MDFEDKSLVLVVIQFWRNLSQFTFPDVQQSDSIMHIYIYIFFFYITFHCRLLGDIEYSSVYCTVGPIGYLFYIQ